MKIEDLVKMLEELPQDEEICVFDGGRLVDDITIAKERLYKDRETYWSYVLWNR